VTEQEWCGTVGARREGRAPEEQSVGGEIDSADNITSQRHGQGMVALTYSYL